MSLTFQYILPDLWPFARFDTKTLRMVLRLVNVTSLYVYFSVRSYGLFYKFTKLNLFSSILSNLVLFCPIFKNKYLMGFIQAKTVIERSRVCLNHKTQPILDTKRKRKRPKTYTHKTNKQINVREAQKPAPSSPSEVIRIKIKLFTMIEQRKVLLSKPSSTASQS